MTHKFRNSASVLFSPRYDNGLHQEDPYWPFYDFFYIVTYFEFVTLIVRRKHSCTRHLMHILGIFKKNQKIYEGTISQIYTYAFTNMWKSVGLKRLNTTEMSGNNRRVRFQRSVMGSADPSPPHPLSEFFFMKISFFL